MELIFNQWCAAPIHTKTIELRDMVGVRFGLALAEATGTFPSRKCGGSPAEAGGQRLTRHEISFAFGFVAGAREQAGFGKL
jgi:hypothetical protein